MAGAVMAAAAAAAAAAGAAAAGPVVAPARIFIAFILPSGEMGMHMERKGDKTVVGDFVDALAAAQRVHAAGTALFPLPGWLLSGDAEPTAGAVVAAIATGACVPRETSVTKLSHTHYYAARMGSPLSLTPPPAAAPLVGAAAGGAVAPADVFIAYRYLLPDGREPVGIYHADTGGKAVVAHITEALAAKQGVDADSTQLFPLPACLLSDGAVPSADAVAAAIATGACVTLPWS